MNSIINKKETFLTNIHPTIKLVITILILVLTFSSTSILISMLLIVFCLVIYITGRISFISLLKLTFSLIIMFAAILLLNWIIVKQPTISVLDTSKIKLLASYVKDHKNIKNEFASRVDTNGINENYYYAISRLHGGTIQSINYLNTSNYQDTYNWATNLIKNGNDTNIRFVMKSIKDSNAQNNNGYLILFYKTYWYTFSEYTLYFSLNVACKIYISILIMTILTSSTSHTALTYSISHILSPLKLLRIPIDSWSTIISLAIRYVPTLLDESFRLINAQAARGADMRNGNFFTKMKAIVSLIVPMFIIAFSKSNDLALAMEARNFSTTNKRSTYRVYTIHYYDILYLMFSSLIIAIVIYLITKNIYIYPFISSDIFIANNLV